MRHEVRLILFRAWCGLKAEQARAYLGFLWWIIEPIIYMGVFYLVFAVAINLPIDNYVSFLLVGLTTWRWFANTVARSVTAITLNNGLINQVYMPKYVFPLIVVVENSVHAMIVFLILLLYLVFFGPPITWTWLWAFVLIPLQLAFIAACSMFVAAIYPFFRDARVLIENGLLMLFFLSGVFFRVHVDMSGYAAYMAYNPMAVLISAYRSALLSNASPDLLPLLGVLALTVVVFAVATTILSRCDRDYPKLDLA